jgi:AcrR family transcriptional regulator
MRERESGARESPVREPEAPEGAARSPVQRGERARERVLRAALQVVADEGLSGFTMEAVARRAGASKATVYRHWSSRGALLIDAMNLGFQPFPLPATGQLRTDLIELLSRLQAVLCGQPFPRLIAAFIDGAERDPVLGNLHAELTERRREASRQVLALARQRGEIPPTTDFELVIDLLAGPLFCRRFITHQAIPEDYASTVVDLVLAAIGHTPPESPERTR